MLAGGCLKLAVITESRQLSITFSKPAFARLLFIAQCRQHEGHVRNNRKHSSQRDGQQAKAFDEPNMAPALKAEGMPSFAEL